MIVYVQYNLGYELNICICVKVAYNNRGGGIPISEVREASSDNTRPSSSNHRITPSGNKTFNTPNHTKPFHDIIAGHIMWLSHS